MNTSIKAWTYNLYSLLYPSFCPGCDRALQINERVICMMCRMVLPLTRYKPKEGNQVEKHFWGKVPVEQAVSLYQFHKNTEIMNLLHALKYKGDQEVGETMGKILAQEYLKTEFFNEIDFIVPVPLHRQKLKKRGYNQCDSICRGISSLTDIPVSYDALIRTRANETQTSKGRFDRFRNTQELFQVNKSEIHQKHVLLIDDVITTGSTLEACAHPLVNAGCKVSIAAVASPLD